MNARTVLVLGLLALPLRPCCADIAESRSQALPSDAELERRRAVIGRVFIDNQNIFDTRLASEDTRLFRLADRLHVRSRESVIDQQLLFHSGELYSRRLLDESARILRSARYLYDASVEPVGYHDGVVDVLVSTRDVWTLNPGVSFGRKGGKNTSGFELEELNVLGTGVSLSAARKSGLDRNESALEIKDAHLFGGWTALQAAYSNNSDGQRRELSLGRPFYALDARSSWGLQLLDDRRVDSIYDRGEIIDRYGVQRRFAEASYGFSRGLRQGWVTRWSLGATYDHSRLEPFPDRKLAYPWIQYERVEDDYLPLVNHDQIGRTEDFALGTRLRARLGYGVFSALANRGIEMGSGSTLLLNAGIDGRVAGGALENTLLQGALRYYRQQSERRLFFTTLEASAGHRLDIDNPILLGGDSGLRGYPLRYQTGDSRALLTVEQRYFTDWYPFRLFRVGGAAFFDAGRVWGRGPLGQESLGMLKDVGLGLRFGNSRSGLGNIIHLDVAYPLDGGKVQFLVETKERF